MSFATLNPVLQESGSVVVESLISFTAIIAIVAGGLTVAYHSFAKVWIDHSSYEALICLGTSSTVFQCEERLRKRLKRALPIGRIAHLRLNRSPSRARVELRLAFKNQTLLRHQASLYLPLRENQSLIGGGM